ncbi:DNA-directed RNA polymerase [Moraxella catarrhalis]|uniref:DNA-directed RNA polymerase n=1 Tax=Moraxella catarrhalis TaxID=480 RepID=UPI002358C328|nr:DNA-directed RNA polymerase [Moraxella catarrhalis]
MKVFNPMQYLAIDIANHFGLDKLNYEERIDWVKTNINSLENMTEQAEEPILFAKAVHALRQTQQGIPTGHTVAFDATCSGLQIMSVLMRCRSGAYLTGLIDPNNRIDAYTLITDAMNTELAKKGMQVSVSRKDSKKAITNKQDGWRFSPNDLYAIKSILTRRH